MQKGGMGPAWANSTRARVIVESGSLLKYPGPPENAIDLYGAKHGRHIDD